MEQDFKPTETLQNNVTDTDGKGNTTQLENTTLKPLPVVPTNEREYSGGNPSPAGYGYDVPAVKEAAIGIRDSGPTTQLTSLPQLTTEDREQVDLASNAPATSPTAGSRTCLLLRTARSQKSPIPFAVLKGTNSLVAFGASFTMAYFAANPKSALNGASELEVLSRFSGLFRERASIREIYAYKSFGEMKDAIISYRSRSIAYTNLAQPDMFALELSREQSLAQCALPFFAKKLAMDYLHELTGKGLKFNPALAANTIDPEVSKQELVLYTQLAGQKTFDPTLWVRMGVLSQLHSSSQKVGPLPQYIIQDMLIPSLQGYTLNGVQQSGYNIQTAAPRYTIGPGSYNSNANLSLLHWVSLYLGGVRTKGALLQVLNQMSDQANSTFNGYKIITGAIDTIEANRGAKFSTLGEFLPITGKHHIEGNCFLNYIVTGAQFSYFFKERFEHSPQGMSGENSAGVNSSPYSTNLSDLPDAFIPGPYNGQFTFQRPAGLYKSDEAWRTDEIAFIGVFKPIGSSSGGTSPSVGDYRRAILLFLGVFASAESGTARQLNFVGTTISGGDSISISAAGAVTGSTGLEFVSYQDAIYGDVYSTVCYRTTSPSDFNTVYPSANMRAINGPTFICAGANKPTCTNAISSLSAGTVSWMPSIGTVVEQGEVSNFAQSHALANRYGLDSSSPWDSQSETQRIITIERLLRACSLMDLSEPPVFGPSNEATIVDFPAWVPQGYRGAEWYDISLTTVENTILDAASNFTMTYKNNAMVRTDRGASSVNTK